MPAFNGLLTPPYTDLRIGEQIALWNAESPAAGATSIVITRGLCPTSDQGILFQCDFTSAPTASFVIYGSNFTPTSAGPVNGVALSTITAQNTGYQDNNSYTYYWCGVTSVSAGEPVTLIAQR